MSNKAKRHSDSTTEGGDPYRTKVNHGTAVLPTMGSHAYPFLAPPERDDEIGRLGNYRVLRLLGKGGMGMVFLAEDLALERPVALKVMRPEIEQVGAEASKRFLREAQAMASIKHDHLVTIYQTGRDRDTVFMAMELLDGETLDAWLLRNGPPPALEILRVAKEIARGLEAVHGRGLIHRDIKPSNLWREKPSGRIKILDFGLVRATGDEDTQLTAAGVIVGTPAYLSPEQARGKRADQRSDLFSFGCVLYRLCTGTIPFPGDSALEQLAALAADDPAPVRQVNPAIPTPLADLVMSLLAKKPEDRPASATDFLQRLSRLKRRPADARPATAPRPAAEQATRRLPENDDEPTERLGRQDKSRRRRHRSFWNRYGRVAIVAGVFLGLTLILALGIDQWRSQGSEEPVNAAPAAGGPAANASATIVPVSTLPQVTAVNWPLQKSMAEKKGGFDKKGFFDKKGTAEKKGGGEKKGIPPELLGAVLVQGRPSPHGIFMHPAPPHEAPASVTYKLDKQFRTFKTTVTINDTAPPDHVPVQFAVYGDGKLLWQSPPVSGQAQASVCEIAVADVVALKLEVTCSGDPRGAHAVWVDPSVVR